MYVYFRSRGRYGPERDELGARTPFAQWRTPTWQGDDREPWFDARPVNREAFRIKIRRWGGTNMYIHSPLADEIRGIEVNRAEQEYRRVKALFPMDIQCVSVGECRFVCRPAPANLVRELGQEIQMDSRSAGPLLPMLPTSALFLHMSANFLVSGGIMRQ